MFKNHALANINYFLSNPVLHLLICSKKFALDVSGSNFALFLKARLEKSDSQNLTH